MKLTDFVVFAAKDFKIQVKNEAERHSACYIATITAGNTLLTIKIKKKDVLNELLCTVRASQ